MLSCSSQLEPGPRQGETAPQPLENMCETPSMGLVGVMFDTCPLSLFNLNNIDIVGIDTTGFMLYTCPLSLLCLGIVPLAQQHPGEKRMFSFEDVQ